MPHIRVRAVDSKQVAELSKTLVPYLAKTIQTDIDNFTVESIGTSFFVGGKEVSSYPFIEVLWFPRSQDIQDAAAKVITDQVRALTQAQDVIVIFTALDRAAYYENGNHF